MEYVKITFQNIPEGKKPPNGFQYVNCHMVFDIEMEDFCRKACLVVGGHIAHTLDTITYLGVAIIETMCITITVAWHDLKVKAADILNAYVTALNREKIWTELGPEFGDDASRPVIIVRALYSLKSAGALFRAHLVQCMQELRYQSCDTNPNL